MRRIILATLFSLVLVPTSAWACQYNGHSVALTVTPSVYYLNQNTYSTLAWNITLGESGCEWWEYNTSLIITGTDEFYYELGQPHWGWLESDINDWLVVVETPVTYHIDVLWWYTTRPIEGQWLFLADDEKIMWVYDEQRSASDSPAPAVDAPEFRDEERMPASR